MRKSVYSLVSWTIALVSVASHATGAEPAHSRHEFARAISQVEEGMPEADVLALLGWPDDVRSSRDPGGVSMARTQEIWRYGT